MELTCTNCHGTGMVPNPDFEDQERLVAAIEAQLAKLTDPAEVAAAQAELDEAVQRGVEDLDTEIPCAICHGAGSLES